MLSLGGLLFSEGKQKRRTGSGERGGDEEGWEEGREGKLQLDATHERRINFLKNEHTNLMFCLFKPLLFIIEHGFKCSIVWHS